MTMQESVEKAVQEQTWLVAKLQAVALGDSEIKNIFLPLAENVQLLLIGMRDSRFNYNKD